MPPNPAPHFTDWLIEMGLTEAAGMGAVPLSWREINAWCAGVCLDLDPWERRLLRRLSTEYLRESRDAESETCPSPWRGITEASKAAELRALDDILG